ncbi:MAG TPA: FtsX-like permease family protein [Gemmatimonadaceae bacterium]|nr:FtsX-like permease family protein [Gemmatimonadaceae bacterium]
MRLSRHDLRVAARSFMRHPGFTCVAVLSLALAIALNTTMYGVLDAMISPQADWRSPGDVYRITLWGVRRGHLDDGSLATMLHDGARAFEGVSYIGRARTEVAVEYRRAFAMVSTADVAPNLFALLGVHPLAGRYFGASDVQGDASPVMISERLSRQLFAGGESGVGQAIDIDGVPRTVIGILGVSATDQLRADVDLWTLPGRDVNLASTPANVVRLRHDVPAARVDAALRLLADRVAAMAQANPRDVRFQLTPFVGRQFQLQSFDYALAAAVLAILLIACANLANLQLARGIGRSRELAVRAALGASRGDLVLQLLVESTMLAVAGMAAALVGTVWGASLLRSHVSPRVAAYTITLPQLNWHLFLFGLVACAFCVLVIGLVPAVRVSRVDPNALLKAGAGTGAYSKQRRQYGAMVVAQIGLSLALLSATAMLLHKAVRVHDLEYGFEMKPLTETYVSLPHERDTAVTVVAELNAMVAMTRAQRDVVDAAAHRPMSVVDGAIAVVTGDGTTREFPAPMRGYTAVSSSYMRTERRAILAGRDFAQGVAPEPEVIVDERTAGVLWRGANPVGKRIKLGADSSHAPWVRVVGVVPNATSLNELRMVLSPSVFGSRVGDIYYLPGARDSAVVSARYPLVFGIVTRAGADPLRMPITMRRATLAFAPGARVTTASMEDWLGLKSYRQAQDFVAGMFALFTTLAVGLAAFGVYGIVAHSVAERRRELGVRIALGAAPGSIVKLVLREGNVFALAGLALGLWLTKDSAWWLRAFSLEDDAYNAPLFAAMAAVLFGVALLAALVPAVRATRIDPVESLRNE